MKKKTRTPATEVAENGEEEGETTVKSKKKGKKTPPVEEAVPAATKKRKHDSAETESSGKVREGKGQKKADKATKEAKTESSHTTGGGITEEERRNVQREIQQLVVRLKKEGKSQAEIDAAKRELKYQFGGSLRNPEGRKAKKSKEYHEKLQSQEAEEERKENKLKKHDLVIIPVVWRGRHDMDDVHKAAEEVKSCVAQQGVDVWVDSRRQLKPGQKFAHWEFRGVMLRVEIGPEDVQAGICRVCLAKEPGEYKTVERRKVPLPPAGARALLLALKELGLSQIDIERREGDSADEEEAAAGGGKFKKSSSKAAAASEADPELEGNWAPRTTSKPAKGKKKRKVGDS